MPKEKPKLSDWIQYLSGIVSRGNAFYIASISMGIAFLAATFVLLAMFFNILSLNLEEEVKLFFINRTLSLIYVLAVASIVIIVIANIFRFVPIFGIFKASKIMKKIMEDKDGKNLDEIRDEWFNGGIKMNESFEGVITTIKKRKIIAISYSVPVIFFLIIFYIFNVEIDAVIIVLLTYVLAVSTGHYAIVNANIFEFMRKKEKFELLPDFSWRINKLVVEEHGTKKDKIIDIYLYLRNIGKGAAKEIDLDILLTSDVNSNKKYLHGRMKLNPIICKEERWLHIELPYSIDDYKMEDNVQGRGTNEIFTINMLYNDIINEKHYSSPLIKTGSMENITQQRVNDIDKIANENKCKLIEIDEKMFNSITESCKRNIDNLIRNS